MKNLAYVSVVLLLSTPCLAEQRKSPAATIELGVQQVEEGDFETAVATLDQGLRALGPDLSHSRERARGYLYMAIAYLGMSEEANAKARFLDALKQDRSLDLSPRQFSPRVLALFEQAKRESAGSSGAGHRTLAGLNPAVFFLAVQNADFAAVGQMLRESPTLVSERDPEFGATPLHWAARKGNEGVAGLLLAAGADQTATNRDGETPLKVAQRSGRTGMVRLLRAHENPIYAAIESGDVGTVRALLDKEPALLNRRDGEFGGAPLHWAAAKGQEAIVSLLLERGADPASTNRAGETPLQAARRVRSAAVIALLEPIDVNLIAAARSGDLEAAQRIVARAPKVVNKPDATFGATPLHWAAIKGHVEMVQLLLAAGADPRATNSAGETPLQVAERAKRGDVVAILSEVPAGNSGRPRKQ